MPLPIPLDGDTAKGLAGLVGAFLIGGAKKLYDAQREKGRSETRPDPCADERRANEHLRAEEARLCARVEELEADLRAARLDLDAVRAERSRWRDKADRLLSWSRSATFWGDHVLKVLRTGQPDYPTYPLPPSWDELSEPR